MMNNEGYQARAAEWLKEHEYKELCSGNGCEVWDCGRPGGSSFFRFQIMIAPMGISVVGDIGDIVFNVYGRGMEFLAGEDVGYYIHSKLASNCKLKEFDHEKVKSVVVETIIEDMAEKLPDEGEEESKVVYLFGETQPSYEQLTDFVKDAYLEKLEHGNELHDYFEKLYTLLEEVDELNDDRSAYELLSDCKVVEFCEVWEYEFTEVSGSVLNVLYAVNHAAKEIMKIKEEKAA